MYLKKIAQQVVDNLMEVIDNRNINIIDTTGIIIASGEKRRIGTYHKGGDDVIIYGKTIEIIPENVEQFEGAKEGVNMPINIEGKIIGVVGVYGQPDEVRMIARLVKKSVELALKQYVILEQTKLATDLKHQLIRILIYENVKEKEEEILCLAKVTGIDLNIKRCAIVFETLENESIRQSSGNIHKIESYISKLYLVNNKDFASILGNNYVLFKTNVGKSKEIFEKINEELNYRIGIGSYRSGVLGYKKSFLEAKECLEIESDSTVNMNDFTVQSKYLFNKINKETLEYYIKPLYLAILDGDGKVPQWFTETMKQLLKYNMNVSCASEALFIHKNTLSYRIKKIENLTGLSLNNNFYHLALLQLLLVYINKENKK